MHELLLSLRVNIASSAVYDLLKSALIAPATREQLVERLASHLEITDATIAADRIIEFAAENGDIVISGTLIYAADSITMQSASGTKFTFGNNSSSKTSTSEISAGHGATIVGTGGARIEQNPDEAFLSLPKSYGGTESASFQRMVGRFSSQEKATDNYLVSIPSPIERSSNIAF